MQKIIQSNPGACYQAHQQAIDAAVARVLQSGWYILGKEVTAFEAEFAAYQGQAHALGVGSGTDAIELALRACGIGPGDGVATVSLTAVATVAAIERSGATPVLLDIDPDTFTLAPSLLEAALADGRLPPIKAMIPVHLYGHPADMPALMRLADAHGLRVIEDCAQAHGAAIAGRKVGTWGHVSAFSFYPTKNLGALGDGGALTTDDAAIADRARLIREYGWRERYVSLIPGLNSRLDELQAAILRVKLDHLDAENEHRRRVAAIYDGMAAGTGLRLPACTAGCDHVYHQYVLRTPRRDALRAFLAERGIGTLVHYPMAVHEQPAYAGRTPLGSTMEATERACKEILSLPMHGHLPLADASRVQHAVEEWHGQAR